MKSSFFCRIDRFPKIGIQKRRFAAKIILISFGKNLRRFGPLYDDAECCADFSVYRRNRSGTVLSRRKCTYFVL